MKQKTRKSVCYDKPLSYSFGGKFLKSLMCLVSVGFIATSAMADTIVKWGEPGGSDMVTLNANPSSIPTSYSTTSYLSPADGTSGYSTNVAGQTRNYYGAMDPVHIFGLGQGGGEDGNDVIQMVKNFEGAGGTVTSMIAWESPDFLTSDKEVESFDMEFATRGGASKARYLIQTSVGWYQSQEFTDDDWTSISKSVGDLTWTSFSLFGVTGGSGTADINDVVSVGAYFTSTLASGNWTGVKLQYFEVTARVIPTYTVAKWGEPGGDSNILVTNANADSTTIDDTYTWGNTITLNAPSTDYYESYNSTNDTPLFNGAGSFDGKLEVRPDGDSDCFYYPVNSAGASQRMYAWETGLHTLTNGGKLVKFTVESRMRFSANSGTRRFIVREGGSWFISESDTLNPDTYTSWSVDPETLEWFDFSPFSSGSYSIGSSASPKFRNYEAVGVFYESNHDTSGFNHARTRYFQVEAGDIPLPPLQGTVILVM